MFLDRRLFWSQFGQDMLSVGRASDLIRYLKRADEGQNDSGMVAMVAQAQMQLGSTDEAEVSWRRVIELAPDLPMAWLNLGRIELGQGHPDEAARLLTRAASLAPESIDAAYNLGLAYRGLGRPIEAQKWEQEAARLRLRREEKARESSPVQSFTPPAP
jgi:tetratricopeptide (TPR) repeat protein